MRPSRAFARLAIAWSLASHPAVQAASPDAVRSEVPIREVVLSDGMRRYAVPVTIGSTRVDAGLDSGSPGLRVVPGTLSPDDARAGTRRATARFGAGAELDGPVGQALVRIGDRVATIGLQLVDSVGCVSDRPDCAAGRIPIGDYGIQGDGLAGEGFKAILGINTADSDVPSVLRALGVTRWIIELPRPGEGRAGRLVLDPSDDEVAGFVALSSPRRFATARGGLHDAVDGCIRNESTRRGYCGALLMDTGAPGVTIEADDAAGTWAPETPASIALLDGRRVVAAARFVVDRRDHASRFTLRGDHRSLGGGDGPTVLYAGLLPYFVWSVLYTADGTIAVRPRPPYAGGPVLLPAD